MSEYPSRPAVSEESEVAIMKIRYRKGAESGDWSREEGAAIRRWNRICMALAVVFALAALVGSRAEALELGQPDPNGFALWFLLCCAYPVLGVLGLVNLLVGVQDSAWMRFLTQDHQILGLFLLNWVTLAILWGVGRWRGLRWLGAEKLRVAANFVGILLGWGILQLLFFGVSSIWNSGGFQPLHSHLRTEEPDKVIVVDAADVPGDGAAGTH